MTSIISTAVLRAAVLSAFDRGRYSVTFATTPAGDDLAVVPSAIILNLEEQDDDLLGSANDLWPELFTDAEERELRREVSEAFGADDHGPAVPAQDGPRVYEFALQDADCRFTTPKTLDEVQVGHAPDMNAFHAADWVHVYDRVTRERRTLKRPAEDKIVRGLADVAADLRDGAARDPLEQALASVLEGHEGRVSKPGEWRVWRDGAGRVRWERFAQPEAVDPAPVPPPAPGPLTSADGLVRGDVLRIVQCGTILRFDSVVADGEAYAGQLWTFLGGHDAEPNAIFPIHQLAFVGRPDADGWMDFPGGENPVGDAMIEAEYDDGEKIRWPCEASKLGYAFSRDESHEFWDGSSIVRFRLVDMPSLPSDT